MITDIVKKYFLQAIIALLVVLLVVQRCSQPAPPKPDVVIKHDTVWVEKHGSGTSVPRVVDSIPYPVEKLIKDTKYVPDTNYPRLLAQYRQLLSLYLSTIIQKDTIKLDTTGVVYITDKIAENRVFARTFTYDYKYPFVKETITQPAKLRNQIYIGGAIQGSFTNPVNQINAGFLLRNKKEQIFGAYTGINMDGQLQLGIQSYWKIHIGK